MTCVPNFTLPLVYSCPGCIDQQIVVLILGREYIRRPSYHPAELRESCSKPCPSPRGCPRKIVRNLGAESESAHLAPLLSSRTSDEESVSSKDSFVVPVLEEIANAILSMTRCVQSFHCDAIANLESLAVLRCAGNSRAVLAADDWNGVGFELLQRQTSVTRSSPLSLAPSPHCRQRDHGDYHPISHLPRERVKMPYW